MGVEEATDEDGDVAFCDAANDEGEEVSELPAEELVNEAEVLEMGDDAVVDDVSLLAVFELEVCRPVFVFVAVGLESLVVELFPKDVVAFLEESVVFVLAGIWVTSVSCVLVTEFSAKPSAKSPMGTLRESSELPRNRFVESLAESSAESSAKLSTKMFENSLSSPIRSCWKGQ